MSAECDCYVSSYAVWADYIEAGLVEDDIDREERLISEREIVTCCQGRNINCGHHYGRQR